jgi:hypothetical protein
MPSKLQFKQCELRDKATGPADGVFTYPYDLDQNFDDHEYLPRPFINLKKSVKRHLIDSISHRAVHSGGQQGQLPPQRKLNLQFLCYYK